MKQVERVRMIMTAALAGIAVTMIAVSASTTVSAAADCFVGDDRYSPGACEVVDGCVRMCTSTGNWSGCDVTNCGGENND